MAIINILFSLQQREKIPQNKHVFFRKVGKEVEHSMLLQDRLGLNPHSICSLLWPLLFTKQTTSCIFPLQIFHLCLFILFLKAVAHGKNFSSRPSLTLFK